MVFAFDHLAITPSQFLVSEAVVRSLKSGRWMVPSKVVLRVLQIGRFVISTSRKSRLLHFSLCSLPSRRYRRQRGQGVPDRDEVKAELSEHHTIFFPPRGFYFVWFFFVDKRDLPGFARNCWYVKGGGKDLFQLKLISSILE